MTAPTDLRVETFKDGGGHRYRIMQGDECLLTSGKFLFEADARSCGEHVASDPPILFDFIGRTP